MARYCPYCVSKVEDGDTCPNCNNAEHYRPKPHHLLPGSLLNRKYLIGRVLGEGGFGITYVGRDLTLDMKVAIKEYFPTHLAARSAVRPGYLTVTNRLNLEEFEAGRTSVIREAQTMAKLDKESSVVGVRDFFECNNSAYIVMEYVDGMDLRGLMKEKRSPLPPQEMFGMVEPIFGALGMLHRLGLIHRDISPDNIMIEMGRARLIDFGCAQSTFDGRAENPTIKHYFSPLEQYLNDGIGPWTDEYAMAATIYYCITDKLPPRATDRMEKDELIPPSAMGIKLKPRQEKALLRALSVRPEDRFPTMEEFGKELFIHKNKTRNIALGACAVALLAVTLALLNANREEVVVESATPEPVVTYVQTDDIPEEKKAMIALLEKTVEETGAVTAEKDSYTLELSNTSGESFELYKAEVSYWREDGVRTDTVLPSIEGSWEPGETLKTDVGTFFSNPASSATVQLYFLSDGSRYMTREVDVPLIYKALSIGMLDECPVFVKSTSYNQHVTTYRIDTAEVVTTMNSIRLTISGEKTEGPDDQSGSIVVSLVDENGKILLSDSLYFPQLNVGERFEGLSGWMYDVPEEAAGIRLSHG